MVGGRELNSGHSLWVLYLMISGQDLFIMTNETDVGHFRSGGHCSPALVFF